MNENNNRYTGPRRIGIERESQPDTPTLRQKQYGRRIQLSSEEIEPPSPHGHNPSGDLSRTRQAKLSEDGPELITERFADTPHAAQDGASYDEDRFSEDFPPVDAYGADEPYERTVSYDAYYSRRRGPDGSLDRPYKVKRAPREEPPEEIEPLDDDLLNYDEFGRKRKKKRIHEEKLMTKSRAIWGWVISIVAAVVIALLVRTFLFEIIMVDGDSMYPTLLNDEKLAVEKVSRYFGLPKHGDIIIVHYPDREGTYVKRVMGLPGDVIEVKDSIVYVNGQAMSEPYINSAEPYRDMEAITVPEDSVFVMGDNRANSLDSRTEYIGAIAQDQIVGHAMYVIWPLDRMHSVQ